ncbi:MAG: tetratricopeptide repeat protein [Sedimentisphaerales bacterium]|nr:tetratricopeptide repeat protein [Sedimentisphaerales bacterium]
MRGPGRWRSWLYRLSAAIGGPLVILAITELCCRLVGVGFDPDPAIISRVLGPGYLVDNPRFSWQFFPPAIARQFEPFVIQRQKVERSCRIIVLGESAVQGVPDGSYAIARVLQRILEEAYQDVRFEVINAGMTAINSHVIYQIAKGLLACKPDVVVIYAGHNEVIGPFGPGTVFAPFQRQLGLIRASIAIGKTRLGQWIRQLGWHTKKDLLASWGGMEMFANSYMQPADSSLRIVCDHYYKNLKDITESAIGKGALVVLCTPASNLHDCPPFASMRKSSLDKQSLKVWEGLFQKAIEAENSGLFERAIDLYRQALQIDDQYAELHFRLARCLEGIGRLDEARPHYISARDLDALRFRADTNLCQAVRLLAGQFAKKGVILADTELACAQASPNQVPGNDLFYEHVHLNFAGNYIVARTIAQSLQGMLDSRFGKPRPFLSEQQASQELAYTPLDRSILAKRIYDEFLTKPPFTNQPYHQKTLKDWQAQIDTLATFADPGGLAQSIEIYQQAIATRPDDWYLHWKLGMVYADHVHDLQAAAGHFRQVLKLVPDFHLAHTALGQVYLRMDLYSQAADEFRQSIRIYDAHPTTHFLIGYAYQRLNDLPKAARHYRLAAYLQPTELVYYTSLAKVLQQMGKDRQAKDVLRRAAKLARR